MSLSRRFLPPMSLLCAFEAAARHASFSAAAAELHLTQSAVSRQIRALEDQLGAALFIRERQTVRLSPAGQAYVLEVREALTRISSATLSFSTNPQGGGLTLAILPTFGTRWLAPRLPEFLDNHPGITISLTTRLAQFDFKHEAVDAAIHFGAPQWPGADLSFLMSETVVPACSPALLAQFGFREPGDLLKAPLLHLASRPDAWRQWLAQSGVPALRGSGMVFDQFAVAAQAAVAGIGVALLPRFLIARELHQGDLVCAFPDLPDMESAERYYLAWPSSRADYPPLQAFRRWLEGAARDFTGAGPA
ncbi:LysR substrate-binding domain-containing protein [Bordetella trematum]|uniref:LysR substrate-binding domain-containing protein n=1 Tax=Bordetella trematum TaxID=123899 RepID=UPI0015C56C82|nr:LysR substrate-binding domain-containing protein [Bordetella trematum]